MRGFSGRLFNRIMLVLMLVGQWANGLHAQELLAPAPESGGVRREIQSAGRSSKDMVAAANPHAVEAGRKILAEGGSAVDAAITVQLVLNVVEPQSSGIGGGLFLVHWEGTSGTIATIDGRETAPQAVSPALFIGADGKPLAFNDAVVGGRSVGVPGTLRALEMAHKKWGKLPWEQLFQPAIELAERGFPVSPRLNGLLAKDTFLPQNERARGYFYRADGKPHEVGYLLKNPAFAKTLKTIATQGADAFYQGEIAQDIVATVTSHSTNPGHMVLADLTNYKAQERPAVCGPYRNYTVCGMGPPGSGGIAILQILGILQKRDMAALPQKPGPEAAHWLSEAGRLAFADRNLYVADPDFVEVPITGLIDSLYLADRAALLQADQSIGKAKPGEPPMKKTFRYTPAEGVENGTSHVSIIDRFGNAVAMTTTIEGGFGSKQMTKSGFLLNNQLTDFNFVPEENGKLVANRVEPGKRPRSSMAPTIVLDGHGKLYAVVGSPGGSQIIPYVAKTLVALLDWKLDPQKAVDLPNFGSRNGPTELEEKTQAEEWQPALEAKGHEVKLMEMNSGIQAIIVTPDGFLGGADSRREGIARGN